MYDELLSVRYEEAVEKEIPLFRTLHYIIFTTAIYMVFGEQIFVGLMHYFPKAGIFVKYHSYVHLLDNNNANSFISACLYSALFVLIVLSLRKGYLRYQIGQVAWSVLTIIIVVYQIRATVPMIMNGKLLNVINRSFIHSFTQSIIHSFSNELLSNE